ncbi:MAG: FtsX-like permease family protein, partial [Pseudomonadota bacterium]|nr:FtsX-like permease family protein [Pseudomonadota bacterium]
GATPGDVMRIFVAQGSVIGIVGTVAGMIIGVLLALNLEHIIQFMEGSFGIKILAADVYFISDLPSDLRVSDVIRITSIALVLALLSTLYPAWRGAKTMPAETLRYD